MAPIESKLLYSATMSLDGFIAGVDGDMSWLTEHLADEPEIDGLVAGIGALLIGKRTFTGDDPNRDTEKEGAFGGRWQHPAGAASPGTNRGYESVVPRHRPRLITSP